ncbi:GumN protein [Clostridiales bacterium oral taxon 876 str. F0540]|nr:GumN protein [Clostridiales bacterium oral taxon 876 str. F0540]
MDGGKFMKKKRIFLSISIILVMFVTILTGCKSNQTSGELTPLGEKKYGDVKGCIWEIKNDKATVYLFGSIHIAQKDMYPFEKTVEDAFRSSNNLVVEVDANRSADTNKLQSKMLYSKNDDVYNHISKEGKEKLDTFAKELGMDMNNLKKMKLWVIESTIMQAQLKKSGYSSEAGVDSYFLNEAQNRKKILELESVDFQLDMLNSFTDEQQEKLFFSDIKYLSESDDNFKKLYDAYKAGDENALINLNVDSNKQDPEIYQKMIVDRNIGMANKIDGYLKTNDSYFVVAGLGHFIGDDSVVKLLEKKGYTVTKK